MRSVPTAILAVILFTVACSAAVQPPCKFAPGGTATVADVRDGRTVLLADGRELRLAAVEVTENSRRSLQSLVGGRDIRWEPTGSEPDRYGRVVAFIFTDETGQSVQQMMLEQGQARGVGAGRRKSLRGRVISLRAGRSRSPPRPMDRPKFRPFAFRKSRPDCGCTGSIYTG